MQSYKIIAAKFLYRFRSKLKLYYSDFTRINKAIDFLEKENMEEEGEPYFQICIYRYESKRFYLTFDHAGFEFDEFHHEEDYRHHPIQIRVSYDNGEAKYHEGSIDDWEEKVNELLNMSSSSDGENEVTITFNESY